MDMNCFYAQVEQQSYNLFGIPVIVGGWRKENGTPRGIVATSSYEARKCGIKTAMSFLEATQLCPYVVPLQVHYEKYVAISRELKTITTHYAPEVEAYSMDESFLDLTHLLGRTRHELEDWGKSLQADVYRRLRLVCSVGISYSKTYAKLASDLHKPKGLSLVLDETDTRQLFHPLSLKEVWGIGSRRFAKLQTAGLKTISDAFERGAGPFRQLFGEYFGQMLWETVTGKDCAKVADPANHIPKEIGYMHTFSDFTTEAHKVQGEMVKAVSQLCYRMRGYGRRAESFHGYIRFQDEIWSGVSFGFQTIGLTNLDHYICAACLEAGMPLVRRFLVEGHRIRGIGLNTVAMQDIRQLELFFQEEEQLRGLWYAVDRVNNHFGQGTLGPAGLKLDVEGKTHFLDRS